MSKKFGKGLRFKKSDFDKAYKKGEAGAFAYIRRLVHHAHDYNPRGYEINKSHHKSDGRISVEKGHLTLQEDMTDELDKQKFSLKDE